MIKNIKLLEKNKMIKNFLRKQCGACGKLVTEKAGALNNRFIACPVLSGVKGIHGRNCYFSS